MTHLTELQQKLSADLKKFAGKKLNSFSFGHQISTIVKMSDGFRKTYERITGNDTSFFKHYDMRISIDKKHKNSDDVLYLHFNENKELIATPITYENDKVEIGTGMIFFEPLISLPIDSPYTLSEFYTKKFYMAIKEKNIVIQ